jgi:N-formylglutamate deformylase
VTDLCPTTTFDNNLFYLAGQAPDGGEISNRLESYWRPYHERLGKALAELKE